MLVSIPLRSRCSNFGLAVQYGLALSLTLLFPPFTRFFELPITFREDCLVATFQLGLGCHVANGAVQTHRVVVLDVPLYDTSSIFGAQRRLGANTIPFDGSVEAFDFAIALGVVRRRLHVR